MSFLSLFGNINIGSLLPIGRAPDLSAIRHELAAILDELRRQNGTTISDADFFTRLRQFMRDSYAVQFASGVVPYADVLPTRDPTVPETANDIAAQVLGDAFWAINTTRGLENMSTLQAVVLLVQFKQGKRLSDQLTANYIANAGASALLLAREIQAFARGFRVNDPAIVAALQWCQRVLLADQAPNAEHFARMQR